MPVERRLDHLARRGRDDEEREPVTLDAAREEIDELRNVVLQPDAAAGLDQVLAPDAAKLRIVPDQIRELSALMDEIAAPPVPRPSLELRDAEQLAQDDARNR